MFVIADKELLQISTIIDPPLFDIHQDAAQAFVIITKLSKAKFFIKVTLNLVCITSWT